MPDKYALSSGKGQRADNRDKARSARRQERAQRQAVDIADISMQALQETLQAMLRINGALRIGLSRDGGAFAFGIYGDGEPYTEYVGASEDVNQYLHDLTEYFTHLE